MSVRETTYAWGFVLNTRQELVFSHRKPVTWSLRVMCDPPNPSNFGGSALGLQKMLEMKHMEVDHEIMRGVPLHWLLPQSRSLDFSRWNQAQELDRKSLEPLWAGVKPWCILVTYMEIQGQVESACFDHAILVGFMDFWLGFVGVALLLCFRAFDVIPDVWENVVIFLDGSEITISMEPWTVMSGGVFMVMGLCISPFLPLKTKICYLDAACIHLAHGELFERGVYSIGGCLSVAKELRVLYFPEYLSSLWCLFEIVGFRKANPDGKLVFSPLFIERSVAICVILVWCIFLIIEVVVSQTPAALRQRYIVLLYLFMYFVPLVLVVHVLRGNVREKKQLIFDLKTFGLEKLTCAAASYFEK